MNYIWIFIGGGLGSIVRYELGQKISKISGIIFPFATISINVISCFILGSLFGFIIGKDLNNQAVKLFVGVGFCGGFSTFSTFTLETFELLKAGNYFYAAANILVSVLVCFFSFWAGYSVSKVF